ncbi:MAG: hypothetical protein ABI904_23530 [Chloroflexota bacterium]
MTTYRKNSGDGLRALFRDLTRGRRFNRTAAWGMMILGALLAFEVFNFSTTQFALADVLGDLKFGGMRWATILAIAFCGMDFAGIARIFTPEQGADEPKEVYYLFGAWLLAAAFNALLTWWGVAVAIVNHTSQSGGIVISNETLTKIVPIFVAAMILFIRILIIGTFSIAGDRMFHAQGQQTYNNNPRPVQQQQQQTYRPAQQQQTYRPAQSQQQPVLRPASSLNRPTPTNMQAQSANSFRTMPNPAPKPVMQQTSFARPEPTYHPYNGQASNDRSLDA